MGRDKAMRKLFNVSVYTKSIDWSYEKEWRVVSFKRPEENGSYSDYSFDGKSIGNLYLGPLVNNDAKQVLIDAAKRYKQMNIYESSIEVSRKINFKLING